LGWNITGPSRRREEGTTGAGGEDDGGAGGPVGRSAEDGGDVPVHAESWRRTGFSSTTSVVFCNTLNLGVQNFFLIINQIQVLLFSLSSFSLSFSFG
jgi:hypothetical protein